MTSGTQSTSPHAWRRDRGTVLLMVVGVLALLAIIAVVYATLGRADRASSAAMIRQQRLDDQAGDIAKYLADVIANGNFATYAERAVAGPGTPYITRARAFDYPLTDQHMISIGGTMPAGVQPMPATIASYSYLFNTSGSYSRIDLAGSGNNLDPRTPGTPFLASFEPAWLNLQNLPFPAPPAIFAEKMRDWPNISNFAPSGNFVNLVNLRNRFDAPSGIQPGYMSSGLTLFDASGNPTLQLPDNSRAAHPNIPADYGANQIFAFRPALDTQFGPSDYRHLLNQWCDTDGDGFVDSRWIELVGLEENPTNPGNPIATSVLPANGRARLFIAVRCIDSSAMVNVNTAGDFLRAPGQAPAPVFPVASLPNTVVENDRENYFPAGSSPTDVNLRTLLSMQDFEADQLNGLPAASRGYSGMPQPAGIRGQLGDYVSYNAAAAANAGLGAYASLVQARRSTQLTSRSQVLLPEDPTGAAPTPTPLSAFDRFFYFDRFGYDSSSATAAINPSRRFFSGPAGMADELELRTYAGVNDSRSLSRLEAIMGGRGFNAQGSTPPQNVMGALSPLRDNRPRSLEMNGRNQTTPDQQTLVAVFADLRHLLTTISGSRPLYDDLLTGLTVKPDLSADLLMLASGVGPSGSVTTDEKDAYQRIFSFYLNALMPYTDENYYPGAWNSSIYQNTSDPAGRAYGGRAEIALHAAAHMLVNLLGAFDRDRTAGGGSSDRHDPTAVSIKLAQTPDALTGTVSESQAFPWPEMTVTPERLPATRANFLQGPDRLNVFGVEPQPFLIEMSSFFMYSDVGTTGGGDAESGDTDPGTGMEVPGTNNITINNRPQLLTNGDFLGEIIAFQLTNPFDDEIILFDGSQPRYYIEFSNRYYLIAEQNEADRDHSSTVIKLAPGATKVFYAINPGTREQLLARFNNALKSAPSSITVGAQAMSVLTSWLNQQFGSDCVQMPMVYPETFAKVEVTSTGSLNGATMDEMDLWGTGSIPASGSGRDQSEADDKLRHAAMLWRVMHAPNSPRGIAESNTENDPSNDLLVDRLRDPAPGASRLYSLREAASVANDRVTGTMAGDDTGSDFEDNKGFSYITWGAVRRPTDSAGNTNSGYIYNGTSGAVPRRGVLPPWCMETRPDNALTFAASGSQFSLNSLDKSNLEDQGKQSDYDNNEERFTTLNALLTASSAANKQIAKSAYLKTPSGSANSDIVRSQAKWMNPSSGSAEFKPYAQVAVEFHFVGEDDLTPSGIAAPNRRSRNAALFSRAGDFLLPLSIGPTNSGYADFANSTTRLNDLNDRWMTFSEMVALASAYYTPADTQNLYYQFGFDDRTSGTLATSIIPKTDRGHLVLDAWTPFLTLSGGQVQPLGNGVPFALDILDRARAAFDIASTPGANKITRTSAYGDATSAIPGVININTAPVSVLRTVPLLSPDRTPFNAMTSPNWVTRDSATGFKLFDPAAGETFDLAVTLAAYRDKMHLQSRVRADGTRTDISFRDSSPSASDGRARANGLISGSTSLVREQRGFKSVGEILAANFRASNGTFTGIDNSFMRFGSTAVPVDVPGLSASRYYQRKTDGTLDTTPDPLFPNLGNHALLPGDVPGSYESKIFIANAAASSLSVRSDIFTVYFVIQGYLPEDVVVEDDQPMIPSIQKRYVMVVDRSNVRARGDAPRIVLLQEVPMP